MTKAWVIPKCLTECFSDVLMRVDHQAELALLVFSPCRNGCNNWGKDVIWPRQLRCSAIPTSVLAHG